MRSSPVGWSLYSHVREELARAIGRRPVGPDDRDPGPDGAEISVESLIADLRLREDEVPVRERTGWSAPRRILVTGGTDARLSWLQSAAPETSLVGIRGAEDGLLEVHDADAIIGYHTPEMIARGTRVRWLQMHTAGVETTLRSAEIAARGILVTNLKRVAAPVIAEHVFATILALSRKLGEFSRHQRHGRWTHHLVSSDSLGLLRGQTLLVAGLGGIGSEVARLAHAFGLRVNAIRRHPSSPPTYIDRIGSLAELDELLGSADVVVNALPLTAKTRGLFDLRRLQAIKRGAIFVNVARGSSVVTGDLTRVLQSGHLAAAALDVTDPQPLPRRHPLWRMPNVLITPHVAGVSRVSRTWGWLVIRENLRRYAEGERMLCVVQVAEGY